MTEERFYFKEGPCDGQELSVPAPAPARIVVGDSGAILNVSNEQIYPCYVRYQLEKNGEIHNRYEYEGAPPKRA